MFLSSRLEVHISSVTEQLTFPCFSLTLGIIVHFFMFPAKFQPYRSAVDNELCVAERRIHLLAISVLEMSKLEVAQHRSTLELSLLPFSEKSDCVV